MLCLQAGASRVFAIDDSAMLDVARKTMQQAGHCEHAIFIHGKSSQIELPVLGDIDLYADHPDFLSWSAELSIERDGVMRDLAGWFECELAKNVWMTNSPLAEKPIQRPQVFLPINEAVKVKAGDTVNATVMARPADHLIAWVVEFPATGQRFAHSTWQGMLFAPEDLIRTNPMHIPQLSRAGQARTIVLGYCDGKRTAQEIEQAVLRDHPELFPSAEEISRFVTQALGRDSK